MAGQEEKKYSLLDELAKSSGYDIALMTTFNFEISFFERAILNRLYANDVKKISLFVDSKELTKALIEVDVSHIGRKYMVNPMEMLASFHPKVILLLGEDKAKLFIGSANIKTSGYTINSEIFNFIEYTPEHSEYLDIINAAINFFLDLNEKSYKLDNHIIKDMKELVYYHKTEENGGLYLFHNMQDSIFNQVKEIITEEVESIHIAVPYYDNELVALNKIKGAYSKADIHLYIQNGKSTFPETLNEREGIAANIKLFEGFIDNPSSSSSNFYHGKVFLFKTVQSAYILYGSANCTQAAFVKAFKDGGNIECNFFEIGELKDFDYFFENLKLQPGEKLVSNLMIFEKQASSNYYFKYGESKNGLKLHLGYNKSYKDLVVYIGDQSLDYSVDKNEIIISVPDKYVGALSDIFDITLQFSSEKETLRCWTYDAIALDANRVKQSDKKLLDGFEINSDGDKYMEDRQNLLRAELTCLPELQEHKKKLAYYNQIKQEQEGDDAESEDFIVDVQIPDEYRVAYKQYNTVSRIRNIFYRRFLQIGSGVIASNNDDDNEVNLKDNEEKRQNTFTQQRQATTDEIRFGHFVRSKVKSMMNDSYLKIIEAEHYIGLVAVILDIFNKYNDVDIFEEDYVLRTRTEFSIKLLSKEIKGDDKEQIDKAILMNGYNVLLENYILQKKETDSTIKRNYYSISRMLLLAMEAKHSIRPVYQEHLYELISKNSGIIPQAGMNETVEYIEELFGYKNLELLEKYISSIYDDASTEVKGTILVIKATATDMRKHIKPDLSVLKEIKSYAINVSPLNTVKILIKSETINLESVKHTISLLDYNWRSTTTRKDGSKWNIKPTYLSF